MNQKNMLLGLVGILVLLSLAVVAYTVLVPNEEVLYDEQMALVLDDVDTMDTQAFNMMLLDNSSEPTIEYCDQLISYADNCTTFINNDTQILLDLNESISNQTRKEYISLVNQYLTDYKSAYEDFKKVASIYKDSKNGKMSQSESSNKISEILPKIDKKYKNLNETAQKIEKMEIDYPFLVSYAGESDTFGIYFNEQDIDESDLNE